MTRPAAGSLNKKVFFEKSTLSDDGYNHPIWENDFSKWAKIKAGKPSESVKSGQVTGEINYVITCRYSAKIKPTHRINHKGRIFEIIGKPVNVDEAFELTEILAREITDA